jgi:hypothetical protein
MFQNSRRNGKVEELEETLACVSQKPEPPQGLGTSK